MSVVMEFAIFPTDKGEKLSKYVSNVIKMIDESGFNYKLNPMGTVIETDTMPQALELLSKAYKVLESDCDRVYLTAKFDLCKSKTNLMDSKISAVKDNIGEVRT